MAFKRLRSAISSRLLPDREQFRLPIREEAGRRAAWVDFLFTDLGILRLFWKNRARVGTRAIRMNQPYPGDVAKAAKQGIRTIVTARHDPRHGGHALVSEACDKLGLAYETVPLFSREAPSREALLTAADFFRRAQYPVLLHCKSGADRAGMLSALYLIIAEGKSVREARQQLTFRHLHFRASRTGILDAVLDAYLAAHPDEKVPFLDWVAGEYDPAALTRDFRAQGFADFIERVLLRRE